MEKMATLRYDLVIPRLEAIEPVVAVFSNFFALVYCKKTRVLFSHGANGLRLGSDRHLRRFVHGVPIPQGLRGHRRRRVPANPDVDACEGGVYSRVVQEKIISIIFLLTSFIYYCLLAIVL